jgi:hypothetical protein
MVAEDFLRDSLVRNWLNGANRYPLCPKLVIADIVANMRNWLVVTHRRHERQPLAAVHFSLDFG